MLEITIPERELWDEEGQRFIYAKKQTLQLEHSLVSLSKWESKWHKPFLGREEKTNEEMLDYIRCMTLTSKVDPDIYAFLTNENIRQINEYINNPMTATIVNERDGGKRSNEIITSELIYYWMIALTIPVEFQKWHLNRLLMLIRVCNAKNQPPKKMSASELASRNRALNEARRKQFNSKG